MSEPTVDEREATKQRMREALDVLQNYVGDDGKLNATKLTRDLRDTKARLTDTERQLREVEARADAVWERCERLEGLRDAASNVLRNRSLSLPAAIWNKGAPYAVSRSDMGKLYRAFAAIAPEPDTPCNCHAPDACTYAQRCLQKGEERERCNAYRAAAEKGIGLARLYINTGETKKAIKALNDACDKMDEADAIRALSDEGER